MKVRITYDFDEGDRALIASSGYSGGRRPRHEDLRLFGLVAIEDKLGEMAEQRWSEEGDSDEE